MYLVGRNEMIRAHRGGRPLSRGDLVALGEPGPAGVVKDFSSANKTATVLFPASVLFPPVTRERDRGPTCELEVQQPDLVVARHIETGSVLSVGPAVAEALMEQGFAIDLAESTPETVGFSLRPDESGVGSYCFVQYDRKTGGRGAEAAILSGYRENPDFAPDPAHEPTAEDARAFARALRE